MSPPWAEAVARAGFEFPSDYQAFAARYGFGEWSSEDKSLLVYITGPTIVEPWPEPIGFEGFVAERALSYPLLTHTPGYDFVPFPEPRSLLGFGGSDAGDLLLWDVTGPDSDLWPVVACSGYDGSAYPFDGGMLAFLMALMRGQLEMSPELVGRRPTWTAYYDWSARVEASGGPAAAEPGSL